MSMSQDRIITSVAPSRAEFADRQAAMTRQWAKNAHDHGDAEALFAQRRAAYLARWTEALRFVPDGSRLLDIGGGNGFAELFRLLSSRRIDYHYLDVDPAAVEASRNIARTCGLDSAQFGHGFNDQLPHPDASFDFVFSSHCLEHSFDLTATFNEVHRVLRPGGSLLMAVPFGWELGLEHPYFFGPNEWLVLLQEAGFEIRTAQIGKEYPQHGHDYFVCARRLDAAPKRRRLDPKSYSKMEYVYLPASEAELMLQGTWEPCREGVIGIAGATAAWEPPQDARIVLPIFQRHDWSGIVEARWGDSIIQEDLFSWHPFPMPVHIQRGAGRNTLELRALGGKACSNAGQIVLMGLMYR